MTTVLLGMFVFGIFCSERYGLQNHENLRQQLQDEYGTLANSVEGSSNLFEHNLGWFLASFREDELVADTAIAKSALQKDLVALVHHSNFEEVCYRHGCKPFERRMNSLQHGLFGSWV